MASRFSSSVAMALTLRRRESVAKHVSPLVLLTDMGGAGGMVRGRRLREDGSLGVTLRLSRVRAKAMVREGLALVFGDETWMVGSCSVPAKPKMLFDCMPSRGSAGVIGRLVGADGRVGSSRVRMSFEDAMDRLRRGVARVARVVKPPATATESTETAADPKPVSIPTKPKPKRTTGPKSTAAGVAERASAKEARCRMMDLVQRSRKEEGSGSEDGGGYRLRMVFEHVGAGSRMHFLVRYAGYKERSWQPLGDFVGNGRISCVLLSYLRREGLFGLAGLDESLYKDCVCACRSCLKVSSKN